MDKHALHIHERYSCEFLNWSHVIHTLHKFFWLAHSFSSGHHHHHLPLLSEGRSSHSSSSSSSFLGAQTRLYSMWWWWSLHLEPKQVHFIVMFEHMQFKIFNFIQCKDFFAKATIIMLWVKFDNMTLKILIWSKPWATNLTCKWLVKINFSFNVKFGFWFKCRHFKMACNGLGNS